MFNVHIKAFIFLINIMNLMYVGYTTQKTAGSKPVQHVLCVCAFSRTVQSGFYYRVNPARFTQQMQLGKITVIFVIIS